METPTTVSLREYVDMRFEAQEKMVHAALDAADKAVSKAETASEKRFDGVNEFRAALSDSARLLMPRIEFERIINTIEERLNNLIKRVDLRDERSVGANQSWVIIGLVVSALANVALVLSYVFKGSIK